MLRERYGVPVGYSGHETGIASSVAAATLGACIVERHITLDRSMWGSDQAASLEPNGIMRVVRDIRLVETSMGDGVKTVLAVGDPGHAEAAAGRALSVAIKAVAMDVDGVLTDGTVWLDDGGARDRSGSRSRTSWVSRSADAPGCCSRLVSGESGGPLDAIAAKFGIADVYGGCKDKAGAVRDFAARHGLELAEVCFIGDDVNDVPAMEICGLAAAPASAQPAARRPPRRS